MDISNTFLPVAVELIQNVFPTPITYIRNLGTSYDPSTGEVTQNTEQYDISAGVISRARVEQGGVGETYSLTLWIDHSATGMPHLPTTADSVEYDNTAWKVVEVNPTYSSTGLIASKIVARSD
jgi:hypothetical protein